MMKIHKESMLGLRTTSLGGYSASEVGRALYINRENASRGSARGKKALDKYEDFKDIRY